MTPLVEPVTFDPAPRPQVARFTERWRAIGEAGVDDGPPRTAGRGTATES
jgi:hypothetical protein